MRKTGLGGVSPFDTRTRPNAFTPLDANDTIFRKGESAIWLRFQPCPCPPQDRVPNCKITGCYDGYIRSVEETVLLREEVSWKIYGLNQVFTRYSPIHSVEKIQINGETGLVDLTPLSIGEDFIKVKENLKYWYAVQMNYRVKMTEDEMFEIDGQNERRLTFDLMKQGKIILDVVELFQDAKPLKHIGNTFDSILFENRINGKITGKIKTFSSIKMGYKTSKIDPRMTQQTGIKFNAGEVDIVPPSYVNLGEGDILTMLYNANRVSQYVPFKTGEIDRLTHSPIASISNCFSRKDNEIIQHTENEDFVQVGYDRIFWLDGKKPESGYTIMYDYHPSFRITPFVEGGAGEDRIKPRQFKGKLVSSYNAYQ